INQLSVFTKLPSELILDIFSYLDIVTIFRFLDTCRYHRYLLLNLPEIWQRVRFIPFRTLISEIYAVLRRFRKENRLVDFVREIYMDSTDSQHFPSPLVMLIKFPNLHTLSSRYRRNQTSLTTDTHTLKDLLRNGDILPHSLKLRKWDIFHPYMTKEDVVGFKSILDAISTVGGVVLDIKMCPGPIIYEPTSTPPPPPTTTTTTTTTTITTPPPQDPPTSPQTTQPTQPACTNIVWTLEKCRVCDASQDRCYRCVGQCRSCGAVRAPPFINHQ
ncbi:hypothetical protein K457DRAFT_50726, partial [Linnemannia elongata AG-77]